MAALQGIVNQGSFTGTNRIGQTVAGHRSERGVWSGTNQSNGAEFTATRQAPGHWEVERTGVNGQTTVNDFTVLTRAKADGTVAVRAFDINRSGFRPL